MPIKVLLVDDEPDLRNLAKVTMRLRGGFEVVGEAGDGRTALLRADELRPEVIVLDLGLPGLAGTDLIGRIRELSPESQIVVYTGTDIEPEQVTGQVARFVSKGTSIEELVDLLAQVGAEARSAEVLQLPPEQVSAAVARRFVEDVYARWGCGHALDEALVVVSELVTNAVVHAGTTCHLRLSRRDDAVRIDVRDEGAGSPDPHVAAEDDEHGRGLLLVSAMCRAWGVEPAGSGAGKSIWAELAC